MGLVEASKRRETASVEKRLIEAPGQVRTSERWMMDTSGREKGLHAGGEADGSLRAIEDVLRGEGRQAASEEGAVLPVERVGAAAAVGCSCYRTCDVINPSPATRDRKIAEQ